MTHWRSAHRLRKHGRRPYTQTPSRKSLDAGSDARSVPTRCREPCVIVKELFDPARLWVGMKAGIYNPDQYITTSISLIVLGTEAGGRVVTP